jgi:hypothetical protein
MVYIYFFFSFIYLYLIENVLDSLIQDIGKNMIHCNQPFELYIKGGSPYNGRLSDFSNSQVSVHRKFKKIDQLII